MGHILLFVSLKSEVEKNGDGYSVKPVISIWVVALLTVRCVLKTTVLWWLAAIRVTFGV